LLILAGGAEYAEVGPGMAISTSKLARAALVDLSESDAQLLRECFRKFSIDTMTVRANEAERFQEEKFDGCVVQLSPQCEPVLEAARSSPLNRRMVIYGIWTTAQHLLGVSKYGINAVFEPPLERQSVLKVIRSTNLLVVHEFRRYIRVPMVTEVSVSAAGRSTPFTSEEISGGGMSLRGPAKLSVGESVELTFTLPGAQAVTVNATVCWVRPGIAGFRFMLEDERRLRAKEWIDHYLDTC
jgi:hypothetical protein